MLRKVKGSTTVTISASYSSIRIPMTVEDGYTISFPTGYALNSTNVAVYNYYYDESTHEVVLGVINTSTSTLTITAMAWCAAEKTIFY